MSTIEMIFGGEILPVDTSCMILILQFSTLRFVSFVYMDVQMGVSKNRVTPKWMVYNGKSY